jgi:mono/diheme cytochrome c family protein
MSFVTQKSLLGLGLLGVAGVVIAGGFVWLGVYNVGADDAHTKPVYAMLQTLRERSISQRAKSLSVPDLSDPGLILQGAGNYDAMCSGCHLAPGMTETELSKGLYPSPPVLAEAQLNDPAHDFWVIKHGIKASGMPAWGKSMEDDYIWGMVAFLQQLPKLDAARYRTLVASSGGHSHGGGETGEHHHDEEGAADGHQEGEGSHEHEGGEGAGHDGEGNSHSRAEGEMHVHADGAQHVHAPKPVLDPSSSTVPSKSSPPVKTATDAAVEPEQHERHD